MSPSPACRKSMTGSSFLRFRTREMISSRFDSFTGGIWTRPSFTLAIVVGSGASPPSDFRTPSTLLLHAARATMPTKMVLFFLSDPDSPIRRPVMMPADFGNHISNGTGEASNPNCGRQIVPSKSSPAPQFTFKHGTLLFRELDKVQQHGAADGACPRQERCPIPNMRRRAGPRPGSNFSGSGNTQGHGCLPTRSSTAPFRSRWSDRPG